MAPVAVPWSPAAPPGSSGSGGGGENGNGSSSGSHVIGGGSSRGGSGANAAGSCGPRRFTFDHLFVPGDATLKLYRAAARGVVLAAAAGYHGSVCAYGQTATGKTYTMQGTNRHPGLLPLAVKKKTSAKRN